MSWNEGARRIFGYEADEIIGKPVLRLIPKELHHEEDFILAKIRSSEDAIIAARKFFAPSVSTSALLNSPAGTSGFVNA
jgi:PAS domain S-box-containing protein